MVMRHGYEMVWELWYDYDMKDTIMTHNGMVMRCYDTVMSPSWDYEIVMRCSETIHAVITWLWDCYDMIDTL